MQFYLTEDLQFNFNLQNTGKLVSIKYNKIPDKFKVRAKLRHSNLLDESFLFLIRSTNILAIPTYKYVFISDK